MITCTQEVRDLFMASHRQVMRITMSGSAIRDSEVVYAILSDTTETPLGALTLDNGTDVGTDATWALFRGYIQDMGEGITITEDDILVGGFVLDRYSMCTDRIEIGSAVAAELTLTLRNMDGTFDAVRFEGAEMHVELGVKDWSTQDPVNWISLGYFTADKQPKNAVAVNVTALDRMVWFDVEVDWSRLTFPCTVQSLVSQVCTICGVTCATDITTLPNYNYRITYAPETKISYRTLIQWCAFLTGTCAQINEDGELVFRWYTDCGVTITAQNRYSHDIEEDDIILSGVYYKSEVGLEYLEGTADYALEMSGCQILQNNVVSALHNISTARSGFTYRPFSAVLQSAPFLEPLDMITFVDKKGDSHPCIISKTTYTGNASTPVSGVGETAKQVSYANLSGLTRGQEQAVDDAKKYATNYLAADATGIMVANMTDGTRYTPSEVPAGVKNTFIDADSFDVRDGTDVIASFGESTRIGKEDENHLYIDATGIQGLNADGANFFTVDMNGAVTTALVSPNKKILGVNDVRANNSKTATLSLTPFSMSNKEVKLRISSQIRQTGSQSYTYFYDDFTFEYGTDANLSRLHDSYSVTVTYSASADTLTIYGAAFMGTGGFTASSSVFLVSYYKATYAPAFLFGSRENYESGPFSATLGEALSASTRDQFACGRYNSEDSTYAFMVGNGSESTGDSNAFVATWDGNILMALDENAVSGTDADLYSALTAFEWEDEVIV